MLGTDEFGEGLDIGIVLDLLFPLHFGIRVHLEVELVSTSLNSIASSQTPANNYPTTIGAVVRIQRASHPFVESPTR